MSKSTQTYGQMRDFSRTPEPKPKRSKRGPRRSELAFVIQRHDARRLHYDLRLAMDGVLKSWAVPKGISHDPKEKRLAIQTEDHPLEYLDFEGVIPSGQYGAGTMTIWDRGTYRLLNSTDQAAAVRDGKLELCFDGGRLRGQWHMVRLKGDTNQWLLFKTRDRYARGSDEPVFSLDLSGVPRSPIPRTIRPMQVGRTSEPFLEAQWLYELQLPGKRVRAVKSQDDVRLRGIEKRWEKHLGRVFEALGSLRAEQAVLDGVLVCLDENQRPSQECLHAVLSGRIECPISYHAFDLLYYDRWDLRGFPLSRRKAALRSIIGSHACIAYVDHQHSRADELFRLVAQTGLPGVIAKRADSHYRAGASSDWAEIPIRGANMTDETSPAADRSKPRRTRRVKMTNRDKVLWPADGYTKGDLIDYYHCVADYILPYLSDRPLSLHRFPSGIEGDSFFHKNATSATPAWVGTIEVPSESRKKNSTRLIQCNDRDSLTYVANLAAIELHPWSSRRGSLDSPDWAILDLDPSHGSFQSAVQIARAAGKLLRGTGLQPLLKTSGAKGLHVYIPLAPGYTYDQVRMFCEGVARWIAKQHPDIATVQRAKAAREGKLYVDFMQNRRGQTVVAPYSVRPLPGATVSAPLDWDELTSDLSPEQFTIQTIPERLDRMGDLFQAVLADGFDLLPAIDRLSEMMR